MTDSIVERSSSRDRERAADKARDRLYNFSPKQQAAVLTDKLARCKEIYDREGGDRTNLAYGYVNKG